MSEYQINKLEGQGEQCWHWRLRDNDGEVIAHSERLSFKGNIVASIKRIREDVLGAPIGKNKDLENQDKGYRFEYRKSEERDHWDWCLQADNHETMVVGKVCASGDSIRLVLENIRKEIGTAKITWENPEDDPDHQAKHDDRTETKGIPGS